MSRTRDEVIREFDGAVSVKAQQDMATCILALEAEVARTCAWQDMHDETGDYAGACGVAWSLTTGDLMTNGMIFCPRCGGTITYTPTKEDQQ